MVLAPKDIKQDINVIPSRVGNLSTQFEREIGRIRGLSDRYSTKIL